MTISSLYQLYLKYPSISIDTRSMVAGDLFFALKGDNFDANLFVPQALEKGAAYCVVQQWNGAPSEAIIEVENVLSTLQQLAAWHRKHLSIPIIAITGSNGKTTTKELMHVVLASRYKTATTIGNLNNHIGVPLTLLRIPTDTEMAVVEMGANHQQEIASYCQFTQPNYGLITNCGKAHLEGFGGLDGVKKGKGELYDSLKKTAGLVFACSDLPYLIEMLEERELSNVVWYGNTNPSQIKAQIVASQPFLKLIVSTTTEKFEISSQLVGDFNLANILAAVCVGLYFDVHPNLIKSAIENYYPNNNRSQLVDINGNKVIKDSYNANPSSMAASIENFKQLELPNKMLFLGSMKEMGPSSQFEHEQLIKLIETSTWKTVVLVGPEFEGVLHPYHWFKNVEEAQDWWHKHFSAGNTILVKGSRSIQMEKMFL